VYAVAQAGDLTCDKPRQHASAAAAGARLGFARYRHIQTIRWNSAWN